MSKDMVKGITNLVIRKIAELAPQIFVGVFVTAETVDANLSQVRSGNDLFRYVPKLASVTLVASDQVLLVKGIGTPMIILGVVRGDIGLIPTL